eukprot:12935765-Prorocentrum_lima.AAC.1
MVWPALSMMNLAVVSASAHQQFGDKRRHLRAHLSGCLRADCALIERGHSGGTLDRPTSEPKP